MPTLFSPRGLLGEDGNPEHGVTPPQFLAVSGVRGRSLSCKACRSMHRGPAMVSLGRPTSLSLRAATPAIFSLRAKWSSRRVATQLGAPWELHPAGRTPPPRVQAAGRTECNPWVPYPSSGGEGLDDRHGAGSFLFAHGKTQGGTPERGARWLEPGSFRVVLGRGRARCLQPAGYLAALFQRASRSAPFQLPCPRSPRPVARWVGMKTRSTVLRSRNSSRPALPHVRCLSMSPELQASRCPVRPVGACEGAPRRSHLEVP